jgi:hypothetical protein
MHSLSFVGGRKLNQVHSIFFTKEKKTKMSTSNVQFFLCPVGGWLSNGGGWLRLKDGKENETSGYKIISVLTRKMVGKESRIGSSEGRRVAKNKKVSE